MSDWDAARYHRVSEPQRQWGLRVLERLRPAAGERILDIGCGTGRLTTGIAAGASSVRVVGVDRSAAMLREADRHFGDHIHFVHADATALPFGATFDAVFSTATFHWVLDHDALFSSIYGALRPGGRLVSQAGGGSNLAMLRARSDRLAGLPEFSAFFAGWREPWLYAGVHDTRDRLVRAGFGRIEVSLESAPTGFADAASYEEFVACVCLRRQLDCLPPDKRTSFMRAIVEDAANDDPPFTLDYWRLNIDARKV